MDQPQTTQGHKIRDTHATAFQDPVSADGKQGEILVTNVQLTCVPKCKLPENLLKINPTTLPSVNRNCTHTIVSQCISVLFCAARCLMVSVPHAQSTLQRIWKTMCKSPCGSAQGGVASLLSTAAWFFVEEVDLICCELNSNVGDRPLPSETSALLVYNLGTSFVE